MDSIPPKRVWGRRKRTWAVLLLWIVVAYPLSHGPVSYAANRGWITEHAAYTYRAPIRVVLPPEGARPMSPARRVVARAYWDWVNWWGMEGFAAASDAEEAP